MAAKGKHLRRKRRNLKPVILCMAIFLAVLGLVACIFVIIADNFIKPPEPPAAEAIVPEKPKPRPEKPPEPEPELEPVPELFNPLTGLPTEEDISQLRPYAVMFNNIKVATPQYGISKADMIYETLAEGGITRLEGIFQDISAADVLGSIRSSRPYFLDIAQGHDAIYIHAGGSNDAYIQIKERGIDNIDGVNGSGETFYRDSWRKAHMGYEHSLMLDTTLIPGYIEKHDIRTEHEADYIYKMEFSDTPKPSGDTANTVSAVFPSGKRTGFSYDAESKEYKVSQYGAAMTDGFDGEQLSVKNVLVLYASMGQISGDDKGRLYGDFTGTGSGYFACEGSCVPITWQKDSYTSQFVYTLEDGTELKFGRGVSYICIVPTGEGRIEFSE